MKKAIKDCIKPSIKPSIKQIKQVKPIKQVRPRLKQIELPIDVDDARISEEKRYLAKIDENWETGSFSRAWCGWLFEHSGTRHQVSYNADGTTMDKCWKALYEIE